MIKNKISRRDFARLSAFTGLALGAGYPLWASREEETDHLCILHTNDTHSRIDPYPDNDPNYPGMGGYALRAALVNKIRKETPHVLLLDAGDIFQGTPYFNVYGGEPELKLMTKMGYDAATMGNHEFDNGLQGFIDVLPHAGFPFVISNYDFSLTPLHEKTLPYKIFRKGNLRIGVYGLGIELEGLVSANLYGNTKYIDPIHVARRMEMLLKEEQGCDLIICLSHLGYQYETNKVSDVKVALSTRYTDIIIGGHTHSLLDPLVTIQNTTGKNVHIGQTGYAGVRLGRIDVYVNKKQEEIFVEFNTTKICKNQVF